MSDELTTELAPGELTTGALENRSAFAITNMRQLQWAAQTAATSRLFGNITKEQAGIIMWKSIRLGVDPLVGLEHIHVINGKPRADGQLLAFLIKQHPDVLRETWQAERTKTKCTISVRMRSGTTYTVAYRIDEVAEIDARKDNWKNYPADMLYWRAVERLAKTHFEGQVMGLADEAGEVVNVRAVEAQIGSGPEHGVHDPDVCGGVWLLQASHNGGAFLRCERCSTTQSPPQEVRDTLRGRTDEFTVNGQEVLVNPEGFTVTESDRRAGADATPVDELVEQNVGAEVVSRLGGRELRESVADALREMDPDKARAILTQYGYPEDRTVTDWVAELPALRLNSLYKRVLREEES